MGESNRKAIMAAMIAAGTPGKEHEALGKFVGTWELRGQMWMEGADGPVVESQGTSETRWLIPGLWLQDEVQMDLLGRPYRGYGINGYDNVKKKFVGVWCDGMSTALCTMEGTLDAEGKTLSMYGVANDPATGQHDKLMGYITHFLDPNHHRFEIRDYSQGPEGVRTMELAYSRKG